MTTEEFYLKVGGDWQDELKRFGSKELVKRFIYKFVNDKSMAELRSALACADAERSFRAAHTLKGVCLNLGFQNLCDAVNPLTEKLRTMNCEGCEEMLAEVEKRYSALISAISELI